MLNLKKYILIAIFFSLLIAPAFPHCDGIDGPVVKAAKEALEKNNIKPVLIWVQEKDEEEIIKVFKQTMEVRIFSDEAKELADKYFFETVVRLHREGEGEPFTGLKPAGRDLGPVIPLADESIETDSVDELKEKLTNAVDDHITKSFNKVNELKNFSKDDVHAGREFVGSYVQFIHFTEQLHELISHAQHHAASEIDNKDIH